MTAKTYLIHTAFYTLALIGLVVIINYVADPYGITGMPRIPHLNAHKVDIDGHVRLMKKYNPLKKQHNALVVGNTRVEIGINPEHRCFRNAGMKLYNFGIPGAPAHTQWLYALNLIYQQPIETVFLGLDLTDFIWTKKDNRFDDPSLSAYAIPGLKYAGSGEPGPGYFRARVLDYFRALFSLESLLASVKTLALQDSAAPDRDDAGFNPARDYAEIVRVEGTRALFDQKMADLVEHFSTRWYLSDDNGRLDPSIDDLGIFLDIATERHIKVFLFINPLHESYWNVLRSKGLMPLHKEWMKALRKLVRSYSPEAVTLWDFSVDSPFIHEKIPAAGQKAGPLQWFWEPSFYRSQLGDLMIEAMLSDSCATPAALGRRVH